MQNSLHGKLEQGCKTVCMGKVTKYFSAACTSVATAKTSMHTARDAAAAAASS